MAACSNVGLGGEATMIWQIFAASRLDVVYTGGADHEHFMSREWASAATDMLYDFVDLVARSVWRTPSTT